MCNIPLFEAKSKIRHYKLMHPLNAQDRAKRCPGSLTTSPGFHLNPSCPITPSQKPLRTPSKNQKSQTPQARLTPASTPAPF